MCGFFGEWAFKEKSDREVLKRISSLSALRGPDAMGFSEIDNLFFGFNRLAILDSGPSGMQPMKSPSGRYMMVYNGEVYNHLNIRKNINGSYMGHSDTETIVHALDRYGVMKTVEMLDGMFSIVVWDREERKLYLIRDFAGIKPLFFGLNSKGIVFASQYDQIVLHPWFRDNEIDPQVLKLYLNQHFVPAPFGIYHETGQVRPGEIVIIDKDHIITRTRYWEFPTQRDPEILDKKQALESLSNELSNSVGDEMLSDVPLGTFLSGGIDSPLITYFAKNQAKDIKSFSIGSDSLKHDESEDAAWYAKEIGAQHYLRNMNSSEALTQWESSMEALHEPFADFSLLPTFVVSKWARKEVTVALSGDGGDELFFGYERFWSVAKNIKFHYGPYWLRYLMYGSDKLFSGNRFINGTVLSRDQGQAHQALHSRFSPFWINRIFPDLLASSLPEEYDVYKYSQQKDLGTLLGYMRKAEFYGMMQKTLRKVDLASMQNSLEVRVPFLKKTFIEKALLIDPYLSYGPGKKKQILKDLLARKIDAAPIDDRKRGFSVPLTKWLRQDLREPIYDLLQSDNYCKYYGLKKEALGQMMNYHSESKADFKWPLFTIYALFKWQENLRKSKSFLQFPISTQQEVGKRY